MTGLAVVYSAKKLDAELSLPPVVYELYLAYVPHGLDETKDPADEVRRGADDALLLVPLLVDQDGVQGVD
jgi:hypothetical protein